MRFSRPIVASAVSCTLVALSLVSANSSAESLLGLLFDGFETGTKATVGALRWTDSAGGVVVSNTWAATGSYSMKFPYLAKADADDDWVEQRFELTTHASELWVRFKMRVPDGYSHRDVSGSDNNKFFKISSNPDTNSSEGVNLMWEYWPSGNGGSQLAYHWTNPGVSVGSHEQMKYVFGPAEAGKVLEFVLHARMSSKAGVEDGVVQTWVRTQGAATFTQIHDQRAAPLYPASSWPTQTTWVAGYVLGWANSSFAKNTTFYIDDLQMSSSSLLGSLSPSPPTSVSVN